MRVLRRCIFVGMMLMLIAASCSKSVVEKEGAHKVADKNNYNELTDFEADVILRKGTEKPHTGKYNDHFAAGSYSCKQCDAVLFDSDTKFDGHCGWPSFDEAIPGAVKELPDGDGRRTEIVCANCDGHLGHVFRGEGYTDKNTRHCVNSVSMSFVPKESVPEKAELERAIFAGGCFWGVEHLLQKKAGVSAVVSGYTGGNTDNPTYEEVCNTDSGHAEAVEVTYDPTQITYEELTKYFLEIHDPTQRDRQGPDVGRQYRSEIFYFNEEQQKIAEKLLDILRQKGMDIATEVTPASKFYRAEDYHQDYYRNKKAEPYCHAHKPLFE